MPRRLIQQIDVGLLVCVFVLTGMGLVIIASVTAHMVPGATFYYAKRQLIYVLIGLVAMGVAALAVDYSWILEHWKFFYGLGVVLLALVLVHGHSALGARRWIQVGPFPLQPSEFAKLSVAVALAGYLSQRRAPVGRLRDILPVVALVVVPALLVMKQPDLGTALVFFAIMAGVLYMAGISGVKLVLGYGAVLAVAVVLIALYVTGHLPFRLPFHGYQIKRLIVFVNPSIDPLRSGYNIIQSKIAIGSGGVWGHGLFRNWDQLSFLPAASTDFIFAVVGLETGFVGGVALLLAYLVFLWRAVRITAAARDLPGAMLSAGLVSMLAFHILVNAGMAMGIMPVVGVPLPFVSQGGSSLITNLIAVGLLLNVRAHPRLPAVMPPVLES